MISHDIKHLNPPFLVTDFQLIFILSKLNTWISKHLTQVTVLLFKKSMNQCSSFFLHPPKDLHCLYIRISDKPCMLHSGFIKHLTIVTQPVDQLYGPRLQVSHSSYWVHQPFVQKCRNDFLVVVTDIYKNAVCRTLWVHRLVSTILFNSKSILCEACSLLILPIMWWGNNAKRNGLALF